jgi:hypothetical protein
VTWHLLVLGPLGIQHVLVMKDHEHEVHRLLLDGRSSMLPRRAMGILAAT